MLGGLTEDAVPRVNADTPKKAELVLESAALSRCGTDPARSGDSPSLVYYIAAHDANNLLERTPSVDSRGCTRTLLREPS